MDLGIETGNKTVYTYWIRRIGMIIKNAKDILSILIDRIAKARDFRVQ